MTINIYKNRFYNIMNLKQKKLTENTIQTI
jgi:hypothetical protein